MIPERTSAAIAEQALMRVFGATAVTSLRADSPLSAVGLAPDDLICLADAVAEAASDRGVTCILDDAALAGLRSVSDLVAAVAQAGSASAESGQAGRP